jgi:hypothetical protein
MGKILRKLRIILRNAYVALGATVMPFLVHAGYGQPQPDLSSYTVPVQGRVVSEETGEPVAGIVVEYGRYAANTDGDGGFLIYVPEEDSYNIRFSDYDGFKNGGFFSYKAMTIPRDELEDPLAVSLYRESQVTVIRGTVRSIETAKPVSGIYVSICIIYSRDGGGYSGESSYTPFFYSGFNGLSDNDGQFSIQAPERDTYSIRFSDASGLFLYKEVVVSSDEIKDSLNVDLEQRPGKDGS